MYIIRSHYIDLCGIKSGTSVVSSQKLVLYQVKDLCGIKSGTDVVSR